MWAGKFLRRLAAVIDGEAAVVVVSSQSRCFARWESEQVSTPVTHQDQGFSERLGSLSPLTHFAPQKLVGKNERVSNWKVHRTCGSPRALGSRRPTPCGSRARRGQQRVTRGAASVPLRT